MLFEASNAPANGYAFGFLGGSDPNNVGVPARTRNVSIPSPCWRRSPTGIIDLQRMSSDIIRGT